MPFAIGMSLTLLFALQSTLLFAQGEDGTPAERDIMILGELLPGLYNNANQVYFDARLKRPTSERHGLLQTTIRRIPMPGMGNYVFAVEQTFAPSKKPATFWLYVFTVDNPLRAVRMKTYLTASMAINSKDNIDKHYQAGCDLLWRQEAGQFHGKLESPDCQISAYDMFLSADALWIRNASSGQEHYAMQRARMFDCYVDVPGVGGGRDIPYERLIINDLHDLGDERWVRTNGGRDIGISMLRVMWPMNNHDNIFTRPSFALYVKEKLANGNEYEKGYTWTVPKAERIGINLKWMLANCAMLSNEEIPAFYKDNEPTVNH